MGSRAAGIGWRTVTEAFMTTFNQLLSGLALRTPLIAAAIAVSASWAAAQPVDGKLAALLAEQKWSDALVMIDAQLKSKPNDVQLLMNRGAVLSNLNRNAEALATFQKVATANPQSPAAYNNMAVILAASGKYEEARAALERAIRTHPTYATAYENLGDLYSHMAGDAYRKALQFDKNLKSAKPKLEMVTELTALASGAPAGTALASADKPGSLLPGAGTPSVSAPATAAPPVRTAQAPAATPVPAPTPAPKPAPEPAKPAAAPAAPAPKPAAEPVKPAATPPAAAPAPAAAAAATAAVDEVQAALQGWARAWSKRDMKGYEASYVPGFKGSQSTHAEWIKERTSRIVPRTRIDVKVSDVKIRISGDQAEVSFQQQYDSDGRSVRSRKSVSMQKQQGKWLIRDESGR